MQQGYKLKRFQDDFEVLHPNPRTCASWLSVFHSDDFLQQFSFPFFVDLVSVSLLVLWVTLNGRSRDVVDLRLLNLHLRPELPECGSVEHQKEAQQVAAAGRQHAKKNVEVLAHAI